MNKKRINREQERYLDRIEERFFVAPSGLHDTGQAAAGTEIDSSRISANPEAAELWRRWNGIELFHGEAQILSLSQVAEATEEAARTGMINEGDLVVGEYGRRLFVLAEDPWEEGAEVVMMEDDGERVPYAADLPRLVLGLLAELHVLVDDQGEYRDDVFDEEDGEVERKVERKMLRRRLDVDPDAPFARFRLASLLNAEGELRAAKSEFLQTVKRAPNFFWAQFELGRVCWKLGEVGSRGDTELANKHFALAASCAKEKLQDPGLQAWSMAWQMRAQESVDETPDNKKILSPAILSVYPKFADTQAARAREALDHEDFSSVREALALGLLVQPRHLGLLDIKQQFESSQLSESSKDRRDS